MPAPTVCSVLQASLHFCCYFLKTEDSSPGTDDDGLVGCGLVDVVSLEKGTVSPSLHFFITTSPKLAS